MSVIVSKIPPRSNAQGFTLLEVLIAMFVLSIGMLGIAGLQVAAARHNYDAKIRTQAALAVNDVMNKIQSRTFENRTWSTRTQLVAQYAGTAPAATCDPTLSDIANELACLQKQIADNLPGATVAITDNGNRSFTVEVKWYNRDLKRDITTDWTVRI